MDSQAQQFPMTSGDFYAAIRLIEVFCPADVFVTQVQMRLGDAWTRVHGRKSVDEATSNEMKRIEATKDNGDQAMSRRLTSVRLRSERAEDISIAADGRKTRREMIDAIRRHAQTQVDAARRIIDANDADFIVETYTGVHYQKNREEVPPEPAGDVG